MASVKMDKYEDVAKQVALEEDDDFEEFETKGKLWSATHKKKKKKEEGNRFVFAVASATRNSGDAEYRSPYLSHAKRALYHLSYIPW